MNIEQLDKGNELLKLIKITGNALENIKMFVPENREEQKEYNDKLFWLYISEHRDGSGKNADLHRLYGNERLIKVIREELERQLKEFTDAFSSL